MATSRSSAMSWARNTEPIPPLPNKRSIRYSPSISRCSRSRSASMLPVLGAPSAPETSAPHEKQYRLFSGIGVWQR